MKQPRLSTFRTVLLAAIGLLLASSGVAVLAGPTSADAPVHKSYVCKYVRKPGAFELLQTGQNPIWVANESLLGHDGVVKVGDQFSDGQFLSVVIVANTPQLDPEPGLSACPQLEPPPPTQVTASAPTFSEPTCAAPTASLQLPSTEGVTYTQSGTAAPGATVTVTATAQPGYALTGQTVWEHTFASVPANCGQTLPPETTPPPQVSPPQVSPPQVSPPAASPPAGAPVTPAVVHAGYAGTPEQAPLPSRGALGWGLLAAGALLLAAAGRRSRGRASGEH